MMVMAECYAAACDGCGDVQRSWWVDWSAARTAAEKASWQFTDAYTATCPVCTDADLESGDQGVSS